MMKKTYLFLTTVCSILLSSTPATTEASIYPDYYSSLSQQPELQGSWIEVEGSWLFLKPCLNGINAAATVTQTGSDRSVQYHDFDFDWQSGFRVGITTVEMFRDWRFSLNYSRINLLDKERQSFIGNDANNGIVSSLIVQGVGFPATWTTGREKFEFLYHDWNLLASYDIQCNKHTLTPYLGLTGLYLTQEIEATFENEGQTLNTEWSIDYSSIGFRTGAKYNYAFSNCFGVYADASLAVLEGSDAISRDQTFTGSPLSFTESDCKHHVYGHRLATGLTYQGVVCCWTYNMHLGYELTTWYKIPQPRVLFGGQSAPNFGQTTPTRGAEIAFHGLVLGCSVMF